MTNSIVPIEVIGIQCISCRQMLANHRLRRPYWFIDVDEAGRFVTSPQSPARAEGWERIGRHQFRCGFCVTYLRTLSQRAESHADGPGVPVQAPQPPDALGRL